MDDDEDEGDDEVEDQPDIHHLDVSGHWQVRVHLERWVSLNNLAVADKNIFCNCIQGKLFI